MSPQAKHVGHGRSREVGQVQPVTNAPKKVQTQQPRQRPETAPHPSWTFEGRGRVRNAKSRAKK